MVFVRSECKDSTFWMKNSRMKHRIYNYIIRQRTYENALFNVYTTKNLLFIQILDVFLILQPSFQNERDLDYS